MTSTQRFQIDRGRSRGSVCEKAWPGEVRRPMETGSGSGWPLVGRDDEVRQALAALEDDAEFQGVDVGG